MSCNLLGKSTPLASRLHHFSALSRHHNPAAMLVLLLWWLAPLCGAQYQVYRQDPFALLSATLQTYQRAACDGQAFSMECPPGTKIAIQLVQYGRSAPSSQVRVVYHYFGPFSSFEGFRPDLGVCALPWEVRSIFLEYCFCYI